MHVHVHEIGLGQVGAAEGEYIDLQAREAPFLGVLLRISDVDRFDLNHWEGTDMYAFTIQYTTGKVINVVVTTNAMNTIRRALEE